MKINQKPPTTWFICMNLYDTLITFAYQHLKLNYQQTNKMYPNTIPKWLLNLENSLNVYTAGLTSFKC